MNNYLIDEILKLKCDTKLITFVGGGGKTTSIYQVAHALQSRASILITTTTHMFHPHDQVDHVYYKTLPQKLSSSLIGLFSQYDPLKDKVKGIEKDQVNQLKQNKQFDLILNEGDGSRSRPLKCYGHHEPMIPSMTDMLVVVIGAEVFNQPLSEDKVHRLDPFMKITGLKEGQLITEEKIVEVLCHKEAFLKDIPDQAQALVLINKASTYPVNLEDFAVKLFSKTDRYKAVISAEMSAFEILKVVNYDQ